VALAGELDYSICMMSLSDDGMTDDRLAQALSVVPQRSIVLLEDIDAAFGSRVTATGGDATPQSRSNLTFSGLLNTLDGVASSEERIVFMTTNYLERLDPALMRPGRVDMVRLLGAATSSQARRMFDGFYDSQDDGGPVSSLANEFAERIEEMDGNPSMAELQGHLMGYKEDPGAAVDQISKLQVAMDERASMLTKQEEEARRMELMSKFGGGGEPRRGVRAGRRITAAEVDKMTFNPQPGWEEQVDWK
jgi:chaperone BCS1